MCGICGVFNASDKSSDSELLVKMRDVMVTRGPDAAGSFVQDGVALGHRRLAILDLTENGKQPMANKDGSVQIVFNGEIYNFQSLREELVSAGHEFKSNSDTEVLVYGYEEWGIDELAKRIRGMFAFAIWDEKLNKLFLVRDHLGKKPLFYKHEGDEISFSSDVKSIWLQHPEGLEIEGAAVNELLYYYFITQQYSIYKDVKKLAPGHLLEFSSEGLTQRCYWKPNYKVKQDHSMAEWQELFDVKFRQAVKRRLVSDVPLGAFLSGGLDSSTVCAVMAEESDTKVKTFCAGYGEPTPLDERVFAKQVADILGTDHTELEISPDVGHELTRIVWHYGEPFADSSAIPSYLIAAEARKHVTVVLTGDGGDEGFAGYPRYQSANRVDNLNRFVQSVGMPVFGMITKGLLAVAPESFFLRRMENLHAYLGGQVDAHARFLCVWDGLRENILGPKIHQSGKIINPVDDQRALLNSLTGQTSVDLALEYVLRQRLPSDYLVKVDVATMAHSLEARSPFLDVDLIEFAMQIPPSILLDQGRSKAVIKEYIKRWLPDDLINRKKAGFEIPVAEWFRTSWKDGVKDALLNGVGAREGYYNPKKISWLYQQHEQGKPYGNQIWSLLVFEIWLRLFIEKSLKPGDSIF